MTPHVHLRTALPWSPWRETLTTATAASWGEDDRGAVRTVRVTVRARTCQVCGLREEITEREGRRWRRRYRPARPDSTRTPWPLGGGEE